MNRTIDPHQQTKSGNQLHSGSVLQRKCACGYHTMSGACTECSKKNLGLQPKLTVGASNDPLEREADRIADQVMAMPLHQTINPSPPRIQRSSPASNISGEPAPASVERVISSPGRPLEPVLREDMERRFGYDFSQVRVHTGAAAEQSARDVSAHAYTVGRNIVFGSSRFSPSMGEGRSLLAHELTHVVQQSHGATPLLMRQTTPAYPNPVASPPPIRPFRLLPATAFSPLAPALRDERVRHGLSRDSGPVVDEIESTLFDTGGSSRPRCTPPPPGVEYLVADGLSQELRDQISLSPTDAPDTMPLVRESAEAAMGLITNYYAPYAPNVPAHVFLRDVSLKARTYGDFIRTNDISFAEFLSWFANRSSIRALLAETCGIDVSWWRNTFVPWLTSAGARFLGGSYRMRERAALFDTWRTTATYTDSGRISLGRAFEAEAIPHTVLHEAMHKFAHTDFYDQVDRLYPARTTTDILIEGFAEYLARALTRPLVSAMQRNVPPPFTDAQASSASVSTKYPEEFRKTVELRDILYRHGQDGEDAIRRAFFLGEGWRFGLLEDDAGRGSPIEMERRVPSVTIRFAARTAALPTSATARLVPIIRYLQSRSVAQANISASTQDYWLTLGIQDDLPWVDSTWLGTADEDALSVRRAIALRTHLGRAGITSARITITTIPTSSSTADEAIVSIIDSRNLTP